MKIKLRISVLYSILLFSLLLTAVFVFADSKYIMQHTPDINVSKPYYQEYYTQAPFDVNVSVRVTPGIVNTSWANSTENCTVWWWMDEVIVWSNLSANDTTTGYGNFNFTNSSPIVFNQSNNAQWRNMTYSCSNQTVMDFWWFNHSVTANFTWFKINEFVTGNDTHNFTASGNLTNGTIYADPYPNIYNMTINETASKCDMWVNDSQFSIMIVNMKNESGDMKHWTNSSTTKALNGTTMGQWVGLAWNCSDAFGNISWSNDTGMTKYADWTVLIGIDTLQPSVEFETFSALNYTTGGDYINVSFQIWDNYTNECWAQVWQEDGTIVNVSGTLNSSSADRVNSSEYYYTNCTVNILPEHISETGNITIVGYANDSAGNTNYTSTYVEFNAYTLKEGWNAITIYENISLSQIAGRFSSNAGLTYVSIWNTHGNWKNFTTYTVDGTTNHNVRVNQTMNVTWVYVSNDTDLIERYYGGIIDTPWNNVTFYFNKTTGKSSWNMFCPLFRATLNQTLYLTNSSGQNSTLFGANHSLEYVSYPNEPETGKYCAGYKGWSTTSCYPTYITTNLTIPRGQAVFALLNITNVTTDTTMCREWGCYGQTW